MGVPRSAAVIGKSVIVSSVAIGKSSESCWKSCFPIVFRPFPISRQLRTIGLVSAPVSIILWATTCLRKSYDNMIQPEILVQNSGAIYGPLHQFTTSENHRKVIGKSLEFKIFRPFSDRFRFSDKYEYYNFIFITLISVIGLVQAST